MATHAPALCSLNYVEQHTERLGIDAEKLDALRTAAARSSPLGDTLELCAVGATCLTCSSWRTPECWPGWRTWMCVCGACR